MTAMPDALRALYNTAGFWRGTLRVRQNDLSAAEGESSPLFAWAAEAATRARVLLEAATGGQDVTELAEFERWRAPAAIILTAPATPIEGA